MQALILAGGEGTRLRPLTENVPKPIVPIGNEPFLLRQIQSLKNAGITDIILATGYQPSAIEKALGDGSAYGVNLNYLIEPSPMGTAGAYKFAERFLHASTIVLNGDILTDIDLQTVSEQHKKYSAMATLVLTRVENPSVYGLVEVGDDAKILRFLEKPEDEEVNRLGINTVNAGIYLLEPEVLKYIPKGEKYSFEYQLFPHLLENRENVRAFVAEGIYWLDIGTPQRYLQAHYDLIAGRIKNLQIAPDSNFRASEEAEIDDRSWIADECVIMPKAKIINSVLGRGVVVEENTVVRNSVIWAGTKINSGASVSNSIIGCDCRIGSNALVGNGSVLGDKTSVLDYARF